jgi:hypothetical protein
MPVQTPLRYDAPVGTGAAGLPQPKAPATKKAKLKKPAAKRRRPAPRDA